MPLRFYIKSVALLFLFSCGVLSAGVSSADEISDLKAQIKKTQEETQLEMRAMEERHQAEMQSLLKRLTQLENKGSSAQETEDVGDVTERLDWLETQVEKSNQEGTVKSQWKDGLRFQTDDGAFKYKIGGRVFTDLAFIGEDDDLSRIRGEAEDGAEVRKAQLFISGTVHENIDFKSEFAFAVASPELKDVFIETSGLPVVNAVRVGHFKEPFSLESLTSNKYSTFMERALQDEMTPGRNLGIMLHSPVLKDRMTWATGVFREVDDQGLRGTHEGGEFNLTSRITGLPWYEEQGRKLLHLGAAYNHRVPHDSIRIRQRPETHLAPRFIDTGTVSAESVDAFGSEAAVVYGPLSVQAEYLFMSVDSPDFQDPDFSGAYVYASYFLTGENRPYQMADGEFGRVKPRKNFNLKEKGLGAWEVAVRYSVMDLSDARVAGGYLRDWTYGLNWYLNPNTRIMLNYIYADEQAIGEADIVQMRFQIDF